MLRVLALLCFVSDWYSTGQALYAADQALSWRDPLVTDVPGLAERHISPGYWIGKSSGGSPLMSAEDISRFNRLNLSEDPYLYDLTEIPDSLSSETLMAKLRSVSRVPTSPRMYADCTPLTEADFARLEASLNLVNIGEHNDVKRALVVRRTPLRSYPTLEVVFNRCSPNKDIDRFQESALFPGDYVAVLHESSDGRWSLVQSYNYIAWVQNTDIAVGERKEIEAFKGAQHFLVVTGDFVETVFNPDVPAVSRVSLDMGVRLPLARPEDKPHVLHGQNTYLSHVVKLPVLALDGGLGFEFALIPRVKDVHVGYLPFTQANIIRQAFKFLGERYGWGHRYGGRDCTGFVSEVYKTFGILLPRNSGDQGSGPIGISSRFDKDDSREAKKAVLAETNVGDLIYIPGHVMMVLGHEDGETWVIHDVTGSGYLQENGEILRGVLNGVSITPTLALHRSETISYLDLVYAIKSIRQQ